VLIVIEATGDPTAHADKAAMLSKAIGLGIGITAAVFAVDLIVNLWRLAGRPGANLAHVRP
jgi:hypothetical protein